MAKQESTDQQSEIIPSQSRMARAALEWGIRDLAKAALVSHDTVVRFERGEELKDKTVDAIREAFERNGVEFIAENGGRPGVRMAKQKKGRKACSSGNSTKDSSVAAGAAVAVPPAEFQPTAV